MFNLREITNSVTIVLMAAITILLVVSSSLQSKINNASDELSKRALEKNIEISILIANQTKINQYTQYLLQNCQSSSPGYQTKTYSKDDCNTIGDNLNKINPLIDESEDKFVPTRVEVLKKSAINYGNVLNRYNSWLFWIDMIIYFLSAVIIVLNSLSVKMGDAHIRARP